MNMAILHIKIAGEHLMGVAVPEHARSAGNNGRAILRQGRRKVDGLFRGPGLRALNALGNALGVNQAVFQHQISHFDWGKNMGIAMVHGCHPSVF